MVSKRSLARLALLVRGTSVKFHSLMTLTYGSNYPLSGRKAKKDLNHFLISAKRAFGPFEHVWCLEFQERGAVHFHIATTLPPPDKLSHMLFARMWTKISTPYSWWYSSLEEVDGRLLFKGELQTDIAVTVQHLKTEHWEKVKNDDGLSHYFAKYSMKIRQKKVPPWYADVGRFWAASEGVTLPEGDEFPAEERHVRELCEIYGRDFSRWEVLPKIILLG